MFGAIKSAHKKLILKHLNSESHFILFFLMKNYLFNPGNLFYFSQVNVIHFIGQ